VYQSRLLPSEQLALNQCLAVLGRHPIVLVKPENLCLDELTNQHPQLLTESFPDDFFASIQGYNRLMLSDDFYARFASYEFILIYQLDAFVFSDQLLHWCSCGYDYIGAPWIPMRVAPTIKNQLRIAVRRKWYRLLDITNPQSGLTHEAQLNYSVGNGGFSLRRIATMRKVLSTLHDRAEPFRLGTRRTWAEDIFFSIEANRYWNHVRTPTVQQASRFSWETNPAVAAQLSDVQLPFGCHAWNKLHRDEWRPIFARLGHSIDALLQAQ